MNASRCRPRRSRRNPDARQKPRIGGVFVSRSTSGPRLALRVDQDRPARRARHLHMMVVPAKRVRHVPVIERSGGGYVLATLDILRVGGAGHAPDVGAHDCAARSADTRREILSTTAADLMAEYAADDTSDNCAGDIDATGAA